MSTYLLTWNPNLWEWANLSEMAAAVTAGEVKFDRWSTGKRTHIPAGSRLFLLRQRVEPRG